jgi:hypothetical protein
MRWMMDRSIWTDAQPCLEGELARMVSWEGRALPFERAIELIPQDPVYQVRRLCSVVARSLVGRI